MTANDGVITFDVAVPGTATLTQTFARFRWSSTVGLDTTTAATDGEVEDYAVTIDVPPVPTATDVCTNRNVPLSGVPDLFWDHNNTSLPERLQQNNAPQFISTPPGIASCLLYTSPSPRDQRGSRMPSSA